MRGTFGFLALIITVGIGMYIYSQQSRSVSGSGPNANPEATVNVIGVKNDLIAIANAERQYNADEGRYGSLDELTSSHFLTISRGRPPYTYNVETSGNSFRVTADTTAPAAPPHLWVDETMVVQQGSN